MIKKKLTKDSILQNKICKVITLKQTLSNHVGKRYYGIILWYGIHHYILETQLVRYGRR